MKAMYGERMMKTNAAKPRKKMARYDKDTKNPSNSPSNLA